MIEKLAIPGEPPCVRPAFFPFASLRLDELTVQGDELRRALSSNPQDTRLTAALLIIEDEKMAIEASLKL